MLPFQIMTSSFIKQPFNTLWDNLYTWFLPERWVDVPTATMKERMRHLRSVKEVDASEAELRVLQEKKEPMSFDTESNSWDPHKRITLVTIGYLCGLVVIFDVAAITEERKKKKMPYNLGDLLPRAVCDSLKDPDTIVLGSNIKEDLRHLESSDLPFNNVHDTQDIYHK